MRRFLQGVLALFRMDWKAFIAADMEDELRMLHEVYGWQNLARDKEEHICANQK